MSGAILYSPYAASWLGYEQLYLYHISIKDRPNSPKFTSAGDNSVTTFAPNTYQS
jgi:hypothetical protein